MSLIDKRVVPHTTLFLLCIKKSEEIIKCEGNIL